MELIFKAQNILRANNHYFLFFSMQEKYQSIHTAKTLRSIIGMPCKNKRLGHFINGLDLSTFRKAKG